MKVIRAKSAGFCFGVERAIDIATTCTEGGKCRVYTDGPLIHNRQMMEKLTASGILEIGDYKSESRLKTTSTGRRTTVSSFSARTAFPPRGANTSRVWACAAKTPHARTWAK